MTKVANETEGDFPPLKDGSSNGEKTTNFTYTVKYVLGGTEKRLDAQWISSNNPMKKSRKDNMEERVKAVEETRKRKEKEEAEKLQRWADKQEEKRLKRQSVRQGSKLKVDAIRKKKKAKKLVKEKKKENVNPNENKVVSPRTKEIISKAEEPENLKVVKIVEEDVKTIKKYLLEFMDAGKDEFGLETLQIKLLSEGYSELAENTVSLRNCLNYLATNTFVYFDNEADVIWII